MSKTCETCKGVGHVDDGAIYGSGGVRYENGPVKCIKECPDCAVLLRNDFLKSSLDCIIGAAEDLAYSAQCVLMEDEDAVKNYERKKRDLVEIVRARSCAALKMDCRPMARIRYQKTSVGHENEMPVVISCDWLPDGVYEVFIKESK